MLVEFFFVFLRFFELRGWGSSGLCFWDGFIVVKIVVLFVLDIVCFRVCFGL